MREILFRGKRVDNGEWETGSLVIIRSGCSDVQVFIADKMTGYHTPVIPDTIGQHIGLTDKNGKKIFEGDITDEGIIEYWEGKYVVMQSNGQCRDDLCWCYNKIEVLGNIHDNPELLGGDGNGNHI